MPTKTTFSPPHGYAVCIHADCPMASSCLHRIAYPTLLETGNFLRLVNPSRCTKDASCSFYRSNRPVTYARGFTNLQKRMFPQQYRHFMGLCLKRWSHNTYYERRRGDRLLPPAEQEFVLNALKEAGVTEDMKFDSYGQNINWQD